MKSSVNGGAVVTLLYNFTREFENFNITVGVPIEEFRTEVSAQFFGQLTNLNIFNLKPHHHIQTMSSNLCTNSGQGDFLSWHEMKWIKSGELIEVLDLKTEEMCGNNNYFSLPLPTPLQWSQARYQCQLLSEGKLAETRSEEELRLIVEIRKDFHR